MSPERTSLSEEPRNAPPLVTESELRLLINDLEQAGPMIHVFVRDLLNELRDRLEQGPSGLWDIDEIMLQYTNARMEIQQDKNYVTSELVARVDAGRMPARGEVLAAMQITARFCGVDVQTATFPTTYTAAIESVARADSDAAKLVLSLGGLLLLKEHHIPSPFLWQHAQHAAKDLRRKIDELEKPECLNQGIRRLMGLRIA